MGEVIAYIIILLFFGLFAFMAYKAIKKSNFSANNDKKDSEKK